MFLISDLSAPQLTTRAISRFKGISNIGNNDGCPSKWGERIKTGGPPKRSIKVKKVQGAGFTVQGWGRKDE
jgi:hypothetical protein